MLRGYLSGGQAEFWRTVSRESDRLAARVACLPLDAVPMSLVSTTGFNCEVWRCAGSLHKDGRMVPLDLVVKHHLESCGLSQVRVFNKHYRLLKAELGEIVPNALFIATMVDGMPNTIVLAEACNAWFNLANPSNETESVELLRRADRARSQLGRFISVAQKWRDADEPRVIDLYGLDNLVVDRAMHVRYLDSFHVFFFPDQLDFTSDGDPELERRISVSLERLAYLSFVHGMAEHVCAVPT